MDLDAFVARHEPDWRRLDELASRRRLAGADADELVALYRQVATHLALVQSRAPDPQVIARLSRALARGRAAAVGSPRARGWAALAHGLVVDFPVVVYRTWRWWVATAIASVGVSAAIMLWLRAHPERIHRVLPSNEVHKLVDHEFRDYYSEHPARAFAAQVWTNNALVAATCLFFGVTVFATLYVLWQNTVNIGLVGGVMLGAGKGTILFGLLLPHGMLELTAVYIASGVGLRTGWAWIAPRERPRGQSLADAGRLAAVTALGLAGVLLISGVIEAFVTPSGLPTWARIGIGVVAEVAFLTYVIVLGRRGVRAGATGDLRADERAALLPTA